MDRRLKVLLLGEHDSKLAGHIQYDYLNMPSEVDAWMVTLIGQEGKTENNFYGILNSPILSRVQRLFAQIYRWVYCIFHLGCFPILDSRHREHAFYDFEYYPYSAQKILKKCPKGFVPDIISIHWHQGFLNTKLIRDLYRDTGAKILLNFVDEAHFTGGCHYPVECENYLSNCEDCPALRFGKKLASAQLASKRDNLFELPLIIYGTPYDIKLAEKTTLFKKAKKLYSVQKPFVKQIDRGEARKILNIGDDKFVVFVGASSIGEVRKGIKYSIKALEIAGRQIDNLLVLVAGRATMSINVPNMLNLGFVDFEKLMCCFSASDCFLSTTIADSGPMMVNYSIALGTPVVSFAVGIAVELVVHRKTGYLAKYKDPDDVVEGIKFFSNLSNAERIEISDNCKTIIEQKETPSWIKQLLAYEHQ